jgi:signal transduction histidine kinase
MKAWFGRTIFSRIFLINIITVLVCLVVLGSTQILLVNRYISHQTEESLRKNGDSIVALIQSNINADRLRGMLSGFSRSSHSHIMLIDNKNRVLISTSDSGFLAEEPRYLPDEYTKEVFRGQRNSFIGTMDGIFTEVMFTLQIPILQRGDAIGAVLISTPIPQKQKMTYGLIRILLISALGVAVISFLLSYMLSKRFSRPIKTIQVSAKAFTKGHFDARVGKTATESEIVEIAELAQTFNEMAYELEKVEETRQSFISDVSHELRTPMTTISGFVNGMMDDTIPQEKQKEYMKIVHHEVTRLSRLVNTFLDISRMREDNAVLNKSHFDINEAIRLTIIGLEQRLQEKRIDVNLLFETDSCYVYADPDAIKRVLTNLLDNAVKFTDEGGTLTVTVKPKQHEVFVTVHNTGCGIPEEQQRMIFERLYKVDQSRSMNKEGTGIGLYLVKSIIRAHGKNITVKSVENEYAEFTFHLDKGKASGKRSETTE